MTRLRRTFRQSPMLCVGLGLVAFLVVVAALAPVIAPYDPKALVGDSLQRPSGRHLLGTNDAGQDIFSQVVWGARSSLYVAFGSVIVALFMAVVLGVAAGLLGGIVDTVVMRFADMTLAIPILPFLIFVAVLAGPSRMAGVLVIGFLGWPQVARVVRSQTLTLRARGFVLAARGFGAGPVYVMRRHLFPALGPVIAANMVFVAGIAVTLESGLAFVGLGDPTAVSWGSVLNRALLHQGLYFSWIWTWWLLPPGLAITATVLGFTFVGVGLEPTFNPRWGRL